jgi:poly(A) polymerase
MAENGILTEVLPVAPMPRRLARYAALEDALAHFPVNPAMRLAALAIAIEEDAERLGEALRLSNEEIRTRALWARTIRAWKSAPPIANEKDEETQLKRRLYRLGKRDYPRDLLIRASLSPHAPAIETLRRQIDLVARWPIPVFPLSGRDLLALGLPPGPGMGELLATLETEWLASNFTLSEDWLRTRARALAPRQMNQRK